jgi:hypothetical protein
MPAQARNVTTTLASLGLEWNVLSTHELPGGSLVWLRVSPNAHDLAGASAARELVIAETGVVARLRVRNPFDRDVLLPSDLVVDGGKQTRVVERSVIIPAASEVDVPVRCVESGRWEARDARTAQTFEVTASASTSTREHLARLKQTAYRTRQEYDLDQNEVWTHVASELRREDLTSATSSYGAVLAKRQDRLTQTRQLAIHAPADANGVAVVPRAGASWIEAFPSNGHVDAAVTALIADLLVGPSADAPRQPSLSSMSKSASRTSSALGALWLADLIPVAAPLGTAGDAFAVDAEGVAGFLLMRADRLAHVAVSVAF